MAKRKPKVTKVYWIPPAKPGPKARWGRVLPGKGLRWHAAPKSEWTDKAGKRHPPPPPKKPTKDVAGGARVRMDLMVRRYLREDADFTDKTKKSLHRVWSAQWRWRWPKNSKPFVNWQYFASFLRQVDNDGPLGSMFPGKKWATQIVVYLVRDPDKSFGDTDVLIYSLCHAVGWHSALSQAIAACREWDSKYAKSKVVGVHFMLRPIKP